MGKLHYGIHSGTLMSRDLDTCELSVTERKNRIDINLLIKVDTSIEINN